MNITSKEKTNDMSTFFINYLMNYSGFDESILEYEFGSASKLSSNANMSTLRKSRWWLKP
jgi:hypothetical protein